MHEEIADEFKLVTDALCRLEDQVLEELHVGLSKLHVQDPLLGFSRLVGVRFVHAANPVGPWVYYGVVIEEVEQIVGVMRVIDGQEIRAETRSHQVFEFPVEESAHHPQLVVYHREGCERAVIDGPLLSKFDYLFVELSVPAHPVDVAEEFLGVFNHLLLCCKVL